MEGLKAEMERKRKAVEKTGLVTAEKKYFKRGDLAKKMGEEYIARMRKIKGFFPETDDDGGRKREKKRQPSSSSSFLDDMLGDDFEKHMPGRSEVSWGICLHSEQVHMVHYCSCEFEWTIH